MSWELPGKTGTPHSCSFPCFFHNNFKTQIIMQQTRNGAAASCTDYVSLAAIMEHFPTIIAVQTNLTNQSARHIGGYLV